MSAADQQAIRIFFKNWAAGKLKDANGAVTHIPKNMADAYADGYNSYYQDDKQLTGGPFNKQTEQALWHFWRNGWIQAFNEHLFPHRV